MATLQPVLHGFIAKRNCDTMTLTADDHRTEK